MEFVEGQKLFMVVEVSRGNRTPLTLLMLRLSIVIRWGDR
jgi:hypothetical protein